MNDDDVRREWAERSGEFSPGYYAYYGPDETSEAIRSRLDATVGPDASVLELGCSSGRHLAHLLDAGYDDLSGIDINAEAFAVMERTHPDLADRGTFHEGAIEDVVPSFDDDRFDAVFSVQTLQHLPPADDAVFGELHRVTGEVLLTAENEGGEDREGVNYVDEDLPLYYRDWGEVFGAVGFDQVDAAGLERTDLRMFEPGGS
jgi:SAM-dependent methyltransferase